MREHPIPQDITGYRFHIIGSMTLKQFVEIALGVVIALIVYKTNLFAPIKWTLIILSIGIGAGAAFLPIEERPLDHWLVTFIKVLYKPTQFYWKRKSEIPAVFTYTPDSSKLNTEPELDLSPARRTRIKEYLQSVTVAEPTNYDTIEDSARIAQILDTFNSQPVVIATPQQIKKRAKKPDLEVRVRKLRHDGRLAPRTEVTVFGQDESNSNTQSFTELEQLTSDRENKKKTLLSTEQVAGNISIPVSQSVAIENTQDEEQEAMPSQVQAASGERAYIESTARHDAGETTTGDVAFNADLPFPSVPTEANKLVGMVLTPEHELVTNAIVEVQLQNGQIVRAVKTNALGQFFISTSLKNGEYVLVVEKEGLTFQPKKLALNGNIVPPIEVRSVS